MPIYEYRCASCGHQQEFLLKVSDAPPTVCTKCGKPSLSKMVTAAGFQLKGSGWYATDFKNGGAKPAAKPADAPKSDATPSGEAKSDAAPSGEAKSDGEKKAAPSCGADGSPAC
jgi:putative FmdB family regulatory protein